MWHKDLFLMENDLHRLASGPSLHHVEKTPINDVDSSWFETI